MAAHISKPEMQERRIELKTEFFLTYSYLLIPFTSDFPQGLVIGSLLFILCINDLDSLLSANVSINLFTDDLKIYSLDTTHPNVAVQDSFLEAWTATSD